MHLGDRISRPSGSAHDYLQQTYPRAILGAWTLFRPSEAMNHEADPLLRIAVGPVHEEMKRDLEKKPMAMEGKPRQQQEKIINHTPPRRRRGEQTTVGML